MTHKDDRIRASFSLTYLLQPNLPKNIDATLD